MTAPMPPEPPPSPDSTPPPQAPYQPPPDNPPAPPPPAAPPANWGGDAPAARMARPGAVTAAGIVMIVLGVLTLLLGLLFLVGAAAIGGAANSPGLNSQIGSLGGAVGGFIAVVAAIVIAFGALQVIAGINILPGKNWARITAIVLAVIAGLLSLPGLFARNAGGGVVISIVVIAAYAFTIWALATNGRWFAR